MECTHQESKNEKKLLSIKRRLCTLNQKYNSDLSSTQAHTPTNCSLAQINFVCKILRVCEFESMLMLCHLRTLNSFVVNYSLAK